MQDKIKEKFLNKSKKLVHHLRQKPEKERRDILHFLMIVVCVFMVALWVFSLGVGNTTPKEAKARKVKTGIEPFGALKANIVNGLDSIQEDPSSFPQ